jgi:hypothetical protein
MSNPGRHPNAKRYPGEDPVTGLTPSGLSNRALHKLVRTSRGDASTYGCARVDDTCSEGRMDWACISRRYLDEYDFMPLCRSHHLRYDMTPERAERAASTHRGRVQTPEHRANISAGVKSAMTEEVRGKMSEAAKHRGDDPEAHAALSEAASRRNIARYEDDEARNKTGAATREWWASRPRCFIAGCDSRVRQSDGHEICDRHRNQVASLDLSVEQWENLAAYVSEFGY